MCSTGVLTTAAFHRCGCEEAVRLTSVALARASSMRVTWTSNNSVKCRSLHASSSSAHVSGLAGSNCSLQQIAQSFR